MGANQHLPTSAPPSSLFAGQAQQLRSSFEKSPLGCCLPKSPPFHTFQLSDQSRVCVGHSQSQPVTALLFSQLQVSPGSPISLVLCQSMLPVLVTYCLFIAPVTLSIQVPPGSGLRVTNSLKLILLNKKIRYTMAAYNGVACLCYS